MRCCGGEDLYKVHLESTDISFCISFCQRAIYLVTKCQHCARNVPGIRGTLHCMYVCIYTYIHTYICMYEFNLVKDSLAINQYVRVANSHLAKKRGRIF